MPFERYLSAQDHVVNDINYYYQDYGHAGYDDADCHHSYFPDTTRYDHHHPHSVQLQIPQFMLNGPPILAPGGGAEVLPAGLLDSTYSVGSSWFANNGFAPFHSPLISRQIASGATPPGSCGPPSYHPLHPNGSQHLLPNVSSRFPANVNPQQQSLPDSFSTSSSDRRQNALSNVLTSDPAPSFPVTSSGFGLPVYSASGFDVLSILSRVVNRPHPTIQLGPVDMSCSFVIVDVRRYDSPIVYASPTFCHLTGYSEQEVLGRNCRFLQSPTGNVARGEPRRFASSEAVHYMRKSLSSSKECQTTLINYRKDGQAFINLVTVIPLPGGIHNAPEEADEFAYHIGFQVDLTEQPTRILDKLRDGSHYSISNAWGAGNGGLPCIRHGLSSLAQAENMTNVGLKGGRHGQMMSIAVSKELRNLIADTTFTDSVPISTGTNMSGPTGVTNGSAEQGSNATTPLTMLVSPPSSMSRMSATGNATSGSIPVSLSPSLSLLLLEFLPDFLLVLSLKGSFLYVAPSVRLVLGYEPRELVGRGISDVCHPADLVPLMRELKEGSVSGFNASGNGDVGSSTGVPSNLPPKSVDLLFRALPKTSILSPLRESQSASAEQGDRYSSQSPSISSSSSKSSSSSGTLCPNYASDASDGPTTPHVWLECRGRLHVEPGKGRKAIILSGRARWMPIVRWGSVDKTGSQGSNAHVASHMTAGSRLCETSPGEASNDPLEFWALLSSQGTFLVASAGVRDVLGWGTSEVIGRSICAMLRDNSMRVCVEAELAKLDSLEMRIMGDPPPSIVTTSLVHRELHTVPIRLAFYRTPRSDKQSSLSGTSIGPSSNPLIHPFNNPLCPIVCQATVLSHVCQSSRRNDTNYRPNPDQVRIRRAPEDDAEDPGPSHLPGTSLFEELEAARASSWQYELQQLRFANQRLHDELNALEGARAKNGTGTSSSWTGHNVTTPDGQSCSSSASPAAIIPPQPQLHYTSMMHSTLSASLPSRHHPSNSLHDQCPPTSDWSSLAGANGQSSNPLKRSWYSENSPTT